MWYTGEMGGYCLVDPGHICADSTPVSLGTITGNQRNFTQGVW